MTVDNANDAFHFSVVTFDYRSDVFFRVEQGEPGFLTKVGSLAGDLQEEPGFAGVGVGFGSVVEGAGLVVFIDQVFDDGTGLIGEG